MDQEMIERIRAAAIGDGLAFTTPYGVRRLTYADATASGRSLSFIEDTIRQLVLPTYGNTHTEATMTGAQTTAFREEARNIIRKAVGANDDDVVIFTGSGMTGAINKLLVCLGLTQPCCDAFRGDVTISCDTIAKDRPVVFHDAQAHHSNDLPWRDSIADVVPIKICPQGRIDLDDLEEQLRLYKHRTVKIGSFSAASNVTGTLTNVRRIAKILHDAGALAFFDYAAAAPYVPINMHPEGDPLAYKDAVFISPHKFPGGPGTPGVLVARKVLFAGRPAVPGGGTVAYVDKDHHRYSASIETREEGGTPDIVGAIRAGLVFKLKEQILVNDPDAIARHELDTSKYVIESWKKNPNIWVLGNTTSDRLGIVSFVIRHKDKALHQGFVVALLNDLFGIQARGGTSCASPYGNYLLHISPEMSEAIEARIAEGDGGVRPGWTRVSFAYYDSPAVVDFLIQAVDLVATEGWRALVDYEFNTRTGAWKHRGAKPELRTLSSDPPAPEYLPETVFARYLSEAKAVLAKCAERGHLEPPKGTRSPVDVDKFEELRWFWLPEEIVQELPKAPPLVVEPIQEEPSESSDQSESLNIMDEVIA